jgi:glycosyltransferase involved in cell wall biosynthesis
MFHTKEGRIKSFFNHLYFKTIEKKIVISALNIQCAELCELNLITRHFPLASVSLIPIGDIAIDRDFKFNPLRKRESLIFGYSGKLVLKENGLDLLLQGFARYKKKFNGDAYLWIVSTSDTSDQIINLASSLHIDHAVKFFKVSEEQELMYLSNIDVLFSSARLFSDHSSLIKAAKLGIPMVINNYSSISDHVKKYEAGILLSRNKATNIATAMKKMEAHFVSHTMRQFGENALKMAEQEYQWENIATNMQTIYHP